MILQLPTGKCVEMSVDQYLRMTDVDLKNLVASNHGDYFNDPFTHSVLYYGAIKEELEEDMDEIIEEDMIEDLLDITSEEKFNDDDYIDYDNIEQ
jgi:hypothetical protein